MWRVAMRLGAEPWGGLCALPGRGGFAGSRRGFARIATRRTRIIFGLVGSMAVPLFVLVLRRSLHSTAE